MDTTKFIILVLVNRLCLISITNDRPDFATLCIPLTLLETYIYMLMCLELFCLVVYHFSSIAKSIIIFVESRFHPIPDLLREPNLYYYPKEDNESTKVQFSSLSLRDVVMIYLGHTYKRKIK